MASKIILKKSSESGKIPQSLEYGELALNYADGVLYYKTSNNQITQLNSGAGGGGSGTTLSDSNFLVNSGTETIPAGLSQQVVVDEFSADSWRSAKYQIQVTSDYTYYTCDIAVLHNGFEAFLVKTNEIILDNSSPGIFSIEFVSSSPNIIKLNFTPEHGETIIVFSRTLLANTGTTVIGDLQTQSGTSDLTTSPDVNLDLN